MVLGGNVAFGCMHILIAMLRLLVNIPKSVADDRHFVCHASSRYVANDRVASDFNEGYALNRGVQA